MSGFTLFTVIEDKISGLLAVGRQRRLPPRWLTEGFVYKFGGEVLGNMSDYFPSLFPIHQVKRIPSAPLVVRPRAVCERIHMHPEQAAYYT